MNHQPTILLGMPPDNGIFHLIETNLKYHGFNVINIVDDGSQFQYPSFYDWAQTKFRQLALRDKQAKQRLRLSQLHTQIADLLLRNEQIDYALFIRADIYSEDILHLIRQHIRFNMVNYQWDGMNRYPNIKTRIPLFDRFYIFDPDDICAKFLPNTNFYFDYDLKLPLENNNDTFYFTGSHLPGRELLIHNFNSSARKKGWNLNFHIYCGSKRQHNFSNYKKLYPNNINIISHNISFLENLKNARRAKALVDLKAPDHNGLSFRIFESIGYQKKLITTNHNVKKYDFYHPNNIFIWDGIQFNGIDNFLETPYYPIDTTIREKYGFLNWIRYTLDLPPYQPINLPAI